MLVWVEEWRRSLGVAWWMEECAHLRGSVVVVVVVEVHSKLVWQVQWVRGVLCHGS